MNIPTSNELKSAGQFQLTQAELLFALRSINLPDIPGVGEKPWGEMELDEARGQFREAGLKLKSRGWVWLDEKTGQPSMEKSLQDVLGACAYPKQMMALVHRVSPSAPVEDYFYRWDDLIVHHTLPQPLQHNFQVSPDSDMGYRLFENLFTSFSWDFESPVGEIPQTAYDQAVQLAFTDSDQAHQVLREAGLSVALGEQFLKGVSDHQVQVHAQWVYEFHPITRQNIIIFFANKQACWMAEKVIEKKVIRIKAINSSSLRHLTQSVFNAF